jgi:hypothetical protein
VNELHQVDSQDLSLVGRFHTNRKIEHVHVFCQDAFSPPLLQLLRVEAFVVLGFDFVNKSMNSLTNKQLTGNIFAANRKYFSGWNVRISSGHNSIIVLGMVLFHRKIVPT